MTKVGHEWGKVTMPDGSVGYVPWDKAAEAQRIIDARHEFVVAFCRERGWPIDAASLSLDQIMEIRAQDGWKNAGRGS